MTNTQIDEIQISIEALQDKLKKIETMIEFLIHQFYK